MKTHVKPHPTRAFHALLPLLLGVLALAVPWVVPSALAGDVAPRVIAYINYDDSGFIGTESRSGNIFATAIADGPQPAASPLSPVTYRGMTFKPLAKADVSSQVLAGFDVLLLFEVCDAVTSFSAPQLTAVRDYFEIGKNILIFDADRCASGIGGAAGYSWFQFPFSTSSPGPQGAVSKLGTMETSALTLGLADETFESDELGDANTATSADSHWCAAAATTNALGNTGYFLAYARSAGGLALYFPEQRCGRRVRERH